MEGRSEGENAMRRSPIRHEVGSYRRKDGTHVRSYDRGSGKRSRRSRRVVGHFIILNDSDFHLLIGKIKLYRNETDLKVFMDNFKHRVNKSKWLYRGVHPSEYRDMSSTGKTIGTHYTIDKDVASSWARDDDVIIRIPRPSSATAVEYDVHGYLEEQEVIVPSGTKVKFVQMLDFGEFGPDEVPGTWI